MFGQRVNDRVKNCNAKQQSAEQRYQSHFFFFERKNDSRRQCCFLFELLTFDNAASDFQRCHNYDGSLSQFGSQQIQKSKSAHQFCSVLALTVTNKCEARRKYLTPAIHSGMPSAPPPLPCNHLFCGIPHCNCTFYFIEKAATQAIFVTEKWGETANLRGFLPRCNLFARVRLLGSYIFGHTAPLSHLSPLQNVTTSECDHGSQLLRASHPCVGPT